MSEFRRDPFTQRWRLFAEGRSARPNEYFGGAPGSTGAEDCPFCEGRESRTPPEVAVVRPGGSPPNGPGWSVRSVPNRFPTVASPAEGRPFPSSGMFARAPGSGVHEVIITSPTHTPGFALLPEGQLRTVFRFFRERVRAISARPGIRAALLFENKGPESGGTLPHPHAQLIASETVPHRLLEESAAFERDTGTGATCTLEAVVRAEIEATERVIVHEELFDAFAPFASEHPDEVWVVPRRHVATFGDASDDEVDRLAFLLPAVLRALDALRPDASYNWFLHGLRAPAAGSRGFHWHVEIAPRLVRADGFELGAGTSVNAVLPELAASEYRAAWPAASAPGPRKR